MLFLGNTSLRECRSDLWAQQYEGHIQLDRNPGVHLDLEAGFQCGAINVMLGLQSLPCC